MTRRICLIFNPVAGQGDPDTDLAVIRAALEPHFELDIRETTPERDADCLAREAIERGVEAIAVSGGDGTLSAAAAALVNSGIPMGAIPRGTANAFAASLGLPDTIPEACEAIAGGATRQVDLARCGDRVMVLLAGIGFEADVVEKTSRKAKDRLGMMAYVVGGFKQLADMEPFEAELESDGRTISVEAIAITVANAAPPTSILAHGGPEVVADDGVLDVTIAAPKGITGALAASYELLRSALNNDAAERDDIGYFRTQQLVIRTDPPQKVAIDGDVVAETPIAIECVPAGLTIFIPTVEESIPAEKLTGLPGLRIEPTEES